MVPLLDHKSMGVLRATARVWETSVNQHFIDCMSTVVEISLGQTTWRASNVRKFSLLAISRLAPWDEMALKLVKACLIDQNADVRDVAENTVSGIACYHDEHAICCLKELLDHPKWQARCAALQSLAKVAPHGEEAIMKVIVKHFEDEEVFVRRAAAQALVQTMGASTDCAIALAEPLKGHAKQAVRAIAAWTLEQIGIKDTGDELGAINSCIERKASFEQRNVAMLEFSGCPESEKAATAYLVSTAGVTASNDDAATTTQARHQRQQRRRRQHRSQRRHDAVKDDDAETTEEIVGSTTRLWKRRRIAFQRTDI